MPFEKRIFTTFIKFSLGFFSTNPKFDHHSDTLSMFDVLRRQRLVKRQKNYSIISIVKTVICQFTSLKNFHTPHEVENVFKFVHQAWIFWQPCVMYFFCNNSNCHTPLTLKHFIVYLHIFRINWIQKSLINYVDYRLYRTVNRNKLNK